MRPSLVESVGDGVGNNAQPVAAEAVPSACWPVDGLDERVGESGPFFVYHGIAYHDPIPGRFSDRFSDRFVKASE